MFIKDIFINPSISLFRDHFIVCPFNLEVLIIISNVNLVTLQIIIYYEVLFNSFRLYTSADVLNITRVIDNEQRIKGIDSLINQCLYSVLI